MANADGELEEILDKFVADVYENIRNHRNSLRAQQRCLDSLAAAVTRANSALLDRIKEEVIGSDVDLPKSIMPKHGQAVQNIQKRKQRQAIDNIAKEIRGE